MLFRTLKSISPMLPGLEEVINKDNSNLLKSLDDLKSRAEIARNKILYDEFDQLVDSTNQDELINFVVQFIPLLRDVVFFPDDELIVKLREYGFSKPVIKWFTSIEDVCHELEELRKLEGALFVLNGYLFACAAYIQTKVVVEAIESFGLNVKHGKNEESNIVHKNFDNLIRRREYNRAKGQKGKMDFGDSIMYTVIGSLEKQREDDFDFEKMLLDASRGKFEKSKEFFQEFFAPEISKSKVYSALFPLLKLTFKDKEMLSQEEFDDLDEVTYGGSYYKYKIARVKKILLKK